MEQSRIELDDDDLRRMAWADAKLTERRLAALRNCSILPGHPDKYFIRSMSAKLPESLSVAQQQRLLKIVWKYRRQIPPPLVPAINPSDPLANPRTGQPLMVLPNGR